MKEDLIQYFKVKSGRYTYVVMITIKYSIHTDEPMSFLVDVGGKMKGCMRISVQRPLKELLRDERFVGQNYDKAYIEWIGYNKQCTIEQNLAPNSGTKHMVKTAMSIVLNAFPWVKHFKLTDASTFVCEGNIEMSLANYSFAFYGKSYYERNLSAYLEDEEKRRSYETAKESMRSENMLPFEQFKIIFDISPKHLRVIQKSYQKSKTYAEFFQNLKTECSEVTSRMNLCEVVHPWLDSFVKYILGERLDNVWMSNWLIDAGDVADIHVMEEWTSEMGITQVEKVLEREDFKRFQNGGRRVNASFTEGDVWD